MHRTGQGIFDGDDRARCAPLFEAAENIFEARARQHFHAGAEHVPGGFFAEGATLALKRDFARPRALNAHFTPSQRRASGADTPSRSSTRSTLWLTMSITVSGWW